MIYDINYYAVHEDITRSHFVLEFEFEIPSVRFEFDTPAKLFKKLFKHGSTADVYIYI
jgi:hypothetical protein